MNCPYCAAITTKERVKRTKLGYAIFFCPHCCCTFNERDFHPFQLPGISYRYCPARSLVEAARHPEFA